MQCPNCRKDTLSEHRVKDSAVTVDICRECRGAWFDADELGALLSVAAKGLRAPSDAQPTDRVCPRCDKPLAAAKYPQTFVTVDICGKCGGLWLDQGELEELRVVRSALERRGEMEPHAPVTGVKGALIRFIDAAIGALNPLSD